MPEPEPEALPQPEPPAMPAAAHHRRGHAANPDNSAPAAARPQQRPDDLSDPDTEVIPVVSYAEELPDLAALRRARLERVAPERVGEPYRRAHRPAEEAQVTAQGRAGGPFPGRRSSRCWRWR